VRRKAHGQKGCYKGVTAFFVHSFFKKMYGTITCGEINYNGYRISFILTVKGGTCNAAGNFKIRNKAGAVKQPVHVEAHWKGFPMANPVNYD